MDIKQLLKKPSHFDLNIRRRLRMAFLFAFFIFAFILLFKPFTLEKYSIEKLIAIGAYFGTVSFCCIYFLTAVLPRLFPALFKNWTVGREISFTSLNIFTVGLANYLVSPLFLKTTLSFHDAVWFQGITVSIGALPVTIMILVNQNRLLKKSRLEAEENERQRLARDLHDGIGGMLSSLLMHTSTLEEENPAVRHSPTLDVIKTTIQNIATDIRQTANNLMPDLIIKLGLAGAIRQYCFTLHKPGLKFTIQTYGEPEDLSLSLKLTIYRIAQELVHNIVKHAMASEVLVQLAIDNNIAGITVEDNGNGFDNSIEAAGFGLKNIQQRVQYLHGQFLIVTAPGNGTAITIELPFINKND